MDNSNCPHLTGVVYNGYEECEMGKACDCDCEWYELQKHKKVLHDIKAAITFCKENSCGDCRFDTNKKICDKDNYILERINEVQK